MGQNDTHHAHKGRGLNRHYNEIRMFTDKEALVDYVNQLESVENVDVYKIDENLYKVQVRHSCSHGPCRHDEKHHKTE
jgi:hypothetical protein